MSNSVIERRQKQAKKWIDDNVWDGDDRSGCLEDVTAFSPDDLQELIDDLIEDLHRQKPE